MQSSLSIKIFTFSSQLTIILNNLAATPQAVSMLQFNRFFHVLIVKQDKNCPKGVLSDRHHKEREKKEFFS